MIIAEAELDAALKHTVQYHDCITISMSHSSKIINLVSIIDNRPRHHYVWGACNMFN